MRDRHLPRLCHSCGGPMARQEDACRRCGAPWTADEQSEPTFRLSVPAVLTITDGSVAVAAAARSLDADRWANVGGTLPGPDRAVATAGSGGHQ